MEPNQQQPGFVSMDYLNQIAPQAPKRRRLNKLQYVVIGAVVFLLVIIIAGVITAGSGSGSGSPTQQLAARLLSTEVIVTDAQSKLKSTELRTLNSNLRIYLTNTNRDIVAPLTSLKIDVKKLDKTVVANEAGTDMISRLEDARLNAVYDRTYAREMSYRLDTIVSLMQKINSSTNNAKLKSFLDGALSNLQPTQKKFSEYNDTNS